MSELQANLMLATAELMRRAGMKRQLTRISHTGENYAAFNVSNGQGRPKTLILPNLVRGKTRVSILSLLESTSARVTRWLCNGQASTGTRQIVHFGDSGRCFLVLSRQTVEARYRALYGERYDTEIAQEAWTQADLRNAPERSRLFFRTLDDQNEIVELAPEAASLPVLRALTGQVQELDQSEFAQVQQLLDTRRYALDVAVGGSKGFLVGRDQDLRTYRSAA